MTLIVPAAHATHATEVLENAGERVFRIGEIIARGPEQNAVELL